MPSLDMQDGFSREEIGFVFAIAEAAPEHERGVVGLVGIGTDFDAHVADVVLDKGQRRGQPRFGLRVVPIPGRRFWPPTQRSSAWRFGIENWQRPLSDVLPGGKLGKLDPGIGIVPGRQRIFFGDGSNIVKLPKVFGSRSVLSNDRLYVRAVDFY